MGAGGGGRDKFHAPLCAPRFVFPSSIEMLNVAASVHPWMTTRRRRQVSRVKNATESRDSAPEEVDNCERS